MCFILREGGGGIQGNIREHKQYHTLGFLRRLFDITTLQEEEEEEDDEKEEEV